MEQLQNLVEVFVQIVLVEHEDGLAQGQRQEGMAESQDTRMAKVQRECQTHMHGKVRRWDAKCIAKEETHLVLCPGEVPHVVCS